MSRPLFIALFLSAIALLAVLSEVLQRSDEFCAVDGNTIEPVTRVEITVEAGANDTEKLQFCSLCCARQWLDTNEAILEKIASGQATITVVDEISGELLDGSLAFWVESETFSRRENKCRLHAFKNEQDAASHIRRHNGREVVGYLAGIGGQLDWAKPFTARDIHGKIIKLSDFLGKVVFLRFWNSTNPFTASDLNDLQKAQVRFQEQGFSILALNVEEDSQAVADFTAELALTFPVLLDPDGKIADSYQVRGYPTGFIIDRNGIIANRVIGELPPEIMEPLLYPLW